jgi:hypothetical protein
MPTKGRVINGNSAMTAPFTYRTLVVLAALAVTSVLGCSSSSAGTGNGSDAGGFGNGNGNGGGGSATLGQTCSSSVPCASGLTCATSGPLYGRCTADCGSNLDLCSTMFGSNAVCLDASQCAITCATASGCPDPQGANCDLLSSGESACVTNPSAPPGAPAPPDGACWNLGGPSGDTVPSGGYRCSISATGELGTGIDQCMNGTWVVDTYTCTCVVSNGSVMDPSQCSDIQAPGSAQCGYGVTSCAQCAQGSGCQTL